MDIIDQIVRYSEDLIDYFEQYWIIAALVILVLIYLAIRMVF